VKRARLASIGRGAIAIVAAGFACVAYSWVMLPDVRPLRKENPTSTAFMRLRAAEDAAKGAKVHPRWRWVSYRRIAPVLVRAVLVSEDARFYEHDGVDVEEIRAAVETAWERGTAPRGASTITQQVAKNLYLSESRNPYRKLVELMIARRLEAELTKTRILEIYLNVIEWGDEIWGAEAAAQTYFGRPAADLSADQAALLAAAIVNPRYYSPAKPNARLLRRQRQVLALIEGVTAPAP